jgi:hypothetical protein
MTVGYKWRLAGRELAGGNKRVDGSDGDGVADAVQDVSDALTAALRRTYGQGDPEVLARVLTGVWGPLRHTMLTDGVTATQTAGGSWKGSAGPITVELWCL